MYNTICNTLANINKLLWGEAVILLLFAASLYLTVKCGFVQFLHPVKILKSALFASGEDTARGGKGISRFQALSTALAASMGTGNMIGVAAAITAGGSGAVFWMVVSSFFVMSFAFTENYLGVKYKGITHGEGALPYIKKALCSEKACYVYAGACMLASFGTGSMAQSGSVSAALKVFGAEGKIYAAAFALVIAVIIFRGGRYIASLAERVIPAAAFIYILAAAVVIALYGRNIPRAVGGIISSAWGLRQAAGGAAGTAVSRAMSAGIRRGIFSNEAGMGSSVFAHTSSGCLSPETAGMWAVFEVFIDTVLCCTLTALVILCTGAEMSGFTGAEMVTEAFRRCFGDGAAYFVSSAGAVFAFASILGWHFYGEKCALYISGGRFLKNAYRILYAAAVYFGMVWSLDIVLELSDIFNAFMMFPNIISILILSREIKSSYEL